MKALSELLSYLTICFMSRRIFFLCRLCWRGGVEPGVLCVGWDWYLISPQFEFLTSLFLSAGFGILWLFENGIGGHVAYGLCVYLVFGFVWILVLPGRLCQKVSLLWLLLRVFRSPSPPFFLKWGWVVRILGLAFRHCSSICIWVKFFLDCTQLEPLQFRMINSSWDLFRKLSWLLVLAV